MDIRHIRVLANEFLGHAAILVLSGLAAWVASHGWHVHFPVIPSAVSATGLLAAARIALKGLVKAFHSGKLEATLVADIKRFGPQVLSDLEAEVKKAI